MNRKQSFTPRSSLARISIWTIINHDFLAGRVRTYVWSASATVLFLSVTGIIPLQIALYLLLFCGLGVMILLWSLIHWRKAILLDIRDEELKQTAHAVMLALIHARQAGQSAVEKQKGFNQRWSKKKSHS